MLTMIITCTDLGPADLPAAYAVIRHLRPHHGLDSFTAFVAVQQRDYGYVLTGAYADGVLAGVMGWRWLHTLSRGRHIHIDDLAVDPMRRGQGIGAALLDHITVRSQAGGASALHLDARATAIGFYDRCGFAAHPSPGMVKRWGDVV
jgi:ribosomal protein S18 acetylase RimI-like enzyme